MDKILSTLTQALGKPDQFGDWLIRPMSPVAADAYLNKLALTVGSVKIRVRDDIGQMRGSIRKDAQHIIDDARAGEVQVVVSREHRKRQRREVANLYTVHVDKDGCAEVSFLAARVILSRPKYARVFEEVGASTPRKSSQPSAPSAGPGERRRTAQLEAEVEALKAQLAQFIAAQTAAPEPTPEPTPTPKRARKSKKDS